MTQPRIARENRIEIAPTMRSNSRGATVARIARRDDGEKNLSQNERFLPNNC
jgi:hypothetical protein